MCHYFFTIPFKNILTLFLIYSLFSNCVNLFPKDASKKTKPKFTDGKKDIVLSAMQLKEWNPDLQESSFEPIGELEKDLMFTCILL